MPIFNWLLYGYGIPALSFWAGSYYLRKRGDDAPLRMVEAAAILFTVLLVFMEIRHFANGGDVYSANTGLVEVALAGLLDAGAGDRPRTAARAHRQHRPQHRRARRDGDRAASSSCSDCSCSKCRCSGG